MGYRWNLDYVVDPAGNLTEYDYATETNYYQMGGGQGTGTLTQYVRGGYPTQISYGWLLSQAIAGDRPAAQVEFGVSQRCLTSSTFTNCAYSNLSSSTAGHWPDTPLRPELRLRRRLRRGLADVLVHGAADVDHHPGAGGLVLPAGGQLRAGPVVPDQAAARPTPVMFLDSIQHTGEDGTAFAAAGDVHADGDRQPGRRPGPGRAGAVPAEDLRDRDRVRQRHRDHLRRARVLASQRHHAVVGRVEHDALLPGVLDAVGRVSPIQDWFNKSLVTQVDVADETGAGSPGAGDQLLLSRRGGLALRRLAADPGLAADLGPVPRLRAGRDDHRRRPGPDHRDRRPPTCAGWTATTTGRAAPRR